KKIVADLQEKEQAHKTYDEAISRGEQAFFLEEDESSGDIFSCNVGNLPPGQEAEVTMKYVLELLMEADGAVRFVLPAVLNPRYTPIDHDVNITATSRSAGWWDPVHAECVKTLTSSLCTASPRSSPTVPSPLWSTPIVTGLVPRCHWWRVTSSIEM
ncbi:unnamed protein product, partial [Staurois parvus]